MRTIFLLALAQAVAVAAGYDVKTLAGTDFVVENATATSAIFSQLEGVATDRQGNVYVSDAADNRIRKITPAGLIHTLATALNHPYGLAVDTAGNVFAADLGNGCVRRIAPDGTMSTVATLNAPRNLAFDNEGSLLISDFGGHRIYRLSSTGLVAIAGTGAPGLSGDGGAALSAQFNSPAGLAVDSTGAIYVADSGNHRIRKILHGVVTTVYSIASPTGVAVSGTTVYVSGATYFGSLTAPLGTFSGIRDLATDAAGTLYFTTGTQLNKIANRQTTLVAGTGADPHYGGDGGAATNARLYQPSALAYSALGSLYIADTGNNRIRRVTPLGLMETFALGLEAPRALAFDAAGNLYVAESHRVRKFSPTGVASPLVDQLAGPAALALDASGVLYIADAGGRILRIGSTVTTAATLEGASGLAFDTDGALLVAAPGGVRKLTPSGILVALVNSPSSPAALALGPDGTLFTTGANGVWQGATAIAGTGIAGFSGDGAGALAAQFNQPSALAFDASGNIAIADTVNNRIRLLTPSITPPAAELSALTVVNAASMQPGPIAPDEIVSLFGANFPPQPDVRINGARAPVFYASGTQINILIPATLVVGPPAAIEVTGSAMATLPTAAASPALFAAIVNEDGIVNSATNGAIRGSVITLYGTGLGHDFSTLTLAVGAYTADILYAGAAPGFPGLQQINARTPAGFAPTGIQPLTLKIAGTIAPPVMLTVR